MRYSNRNATSEEVKWMTEKGESLVDRIARFYFVNNSTVREIAKALNLPKSNVHYWIKKYRRLLLDEYKSLSERKKVKAFSGIVGFLTQVRNLKKESWRIYYDTEECSQDITGPKGPIMIFGDSRYDRVGGKEDDDDKVLHNFLEMLKISLPAHDTESHCLDSLGKFTMLELRIFEKFGLLKDDAGKVLLEGIDLDDKVEKIISKCVSIVKEEIQNEDVKSRLLNRIDKELLKKIIKS